MGGEKEGENGGERGVRWLSAQVSVLVSTRLRRRPRGKGNESAYEYAYETSDLRRRGQAPRSPAGAWFRSYAYSTRPDSRSLDDTRPRGAETETGSALTPALVT